MNPGGVHLTRKRRLAGVIWPKYRKIADSFNRNTEFLDFIRRSPSVPIFPNAPKLFEFLKLEVLHDEAIDYLEFGVYRGGSLRFWSELNRASDSRFFGFDSFEGLPEKWDANEKGTFRVASLPQFDDPRVHLIKGLFQDTLPTFMSTFRPGRRLVVHIDCDLYSSTLFALTKVDSILQAGSILLFDEFEDLLHEFRAFDDYRRAYRREFRLLGATAKFLQVALMLEAPVEGR